MTMPKRYTESLSAIVASLPNCIEQLEAATTSLAEKKSALQNQGLIYASPHMKDGKYLVLLYPIQPGEARRRQYIGNDPAKVSDALAKIRRAKEYDELVERERQIVSAMQEGLLSLQAASRALSRTL
jgi:exonuclease VII small subunit